jgi:hypothetical protein
VTPQSFFSIGLRLIGVWKLTDAIDCSVTAYNVSAGVSKTDLLSTWSYINHAIGFGVLGVVLLLGAPLIAAVLVGPAKEQ